MKKIIYFLGIVFLFWTSCCEQPHFAVRGSVNGMDTGYIFLLERSSRGYDTLARSPVVNGKFEMSGSVSGTTPAFFTFEGRFNKFLTFVENTDIRAVLDLQNIRNTSITGTRHQAVIDSFHAAQRIANIAEFYFQTNSYKAGSEEAMETMRQEYRNKMKLAFDEEARLIRLNPDSKVSSYMLSLRMDNMNRKDLEFMYGLLGEKAKSDKWGRAVKARLDNSLASAEGQIAPDFTMNTPEGKTLSMHSIKARVKLLDFWASWCSPCRKENPNMAAIYAAYHDKGLEILSISLDSQKDAWIKAIEQDGLGWYHVSDLNGWNSDAAVIYCIKGIPHTVLLDADNRIIARNLRGEELRKKIAGLLD